MIPMLLTAVQFAAVISSFEAAYQHYSFQKAEVHRDAITNDLVAFANFSEDQGALRVGCDFRESPELSVTLETKSPIAGEANLFLLDPGRGTGSNLLGSSSKLQIRFGDTNAYIQRWNTLGRRATIARRNSMAFINALQSSDTLAMRYVDIEDREITLTFDISRASEVIEPIVAMCTDEARLDAT